MEIVDLISWEEFEERIERLSHWRAERKRGVPGRKAGTYVSEYLFRGQADSDWSLETTLERYTGRMLSLTEYYQLVWAVKSEVESYAGTRWKIPSPFDYSVQLDKPGFFPIGPFIGYDYFAYLRHYGFPSPFLKWTLSPYVAAYFAFRDVSGVPTTDVSIFAYCEYKGKDRLFADGRPQIYGLGPDVRSHYRHFQQQNQYTVCLAGQGISRSYARHDEASSRIQDEHNELWKFNIPQSERQKVLKRLEQYDVNALSLYDSEEGLMETICLREIFLGGRVQRTQDLSRTTR